MIRLPKWVVVVLALAIVVGMAAPAVAAEVKGKIKTVSADKKELTCTDKDGKEWTFQIPAETKIRLADKDVKLNDLKAGEEVTVTYEKKGDTFIASEVRCEKK